MYNDISANIQIVLFEVEVDTSARILLHILAPTLQVVRMISEVT